MKQRADQYLIKFVKHLKRLNDDVEFDLPNLSINDILENPRDFAFALVEREFTDAIPKFLEAYNLGKKYADENRGIVKSDDGKNLYYVESSEIVDKNLPPKYQYGDTLNHPNQLCNNCKFYLETKTGEEYCSFWDANVKGLYWCAKWKGLKNG